MSAPLLKETAAHAMRWLRWQLGDESDRPMPWELFADGLERQRDAARNVADQYISKANAHDFEVLGYRETIKALEAEIEDKRDAIQSAANQIDKWRNESRSNADRCHKSEERNNQLERDIESMNNKLECKIAEISNNVKEIIASKNAMIDAQTMQLAQLEDELASKDGYPAQNTLEIDRARERITELEEYAKYAELPKAQPVDDGGPARDITLRDWFAGVAMQGFIASARCDELRKKLTTDSCMGVAAFESLCAADAMLSARNGKGGA